MTDRCARRVVTNPHQRSHASCVDSVACGSASRVTELSRCELALLVEECEDA